MEAAYNKKQKEGFEEMEMSTFKMKIRDLVDLPPAHIKSRKEFIVESGELTLANLNLKKDFVYKPNFSFDAESYKKSNDIDLDAYVNKKELRMYQKAYI